MGGRDQERDAIEREVQERASRGGLRGGVRQDEVERLANGMRSADGERFAEAQALRERSPQIRLRLIAAGACGIVALLILWTLLNRTRPSIGDVAPTLLASPAPSATPLVSATPVASAAQAASASASGRAIVCGLPGGPSCPPRP